MICELLILKIYLKHWLNVFLTHDISFESRKKWPRETVFFMSEHMCRVIGSLARLNMFFLDCALISVLFFVGKVPPCFLDKRINRYES